MREYGLVERRFAALHIRESVEKQKELGKKLPSYASYETIAETMMHEYNVSHLFLQTASPGALSELTRWAHATRTVLAFTHNPRGEHDSWAGWKSGRQMLEATIAAVNLHIASKAIVFVGIASSMCGTTCSCHFWVPVANPNRSMSSAPTRFGRSLLPRALTLSSECPMQHAALRKSATVSPSHRGGVGSGEGAKVSP